MTPLLLHFQKKYIARRVNQESIDMLKSDIADFKKSNNPTLEQQEVINWLQDLAIRSEGVLKHGLKLKVIPWEGA